MIVQLDMSSDDAKAIVDFLNDDNGLRSAVVERLIPENKPPFIARLTSVSAGLGAISRALTLALDAERQLDAAWRAERDAEARRMAGLD